MRSFQTTESNCFFFNFPGWFIRRKVNRIKSGLFLSVVFNLRSVLSVIMINDTNVLPTVASLLRWKLTKVYCSSTTKKHEIELPKTYYNNLYTGCECYNCWIYSLKFLAPNAKYCVWLLTSVGFLFDSVYVSFYFLQAQTGRSRKVARKRRKEVAKTNFVSLINI